METQIARVEMTISGPVTASLVEKRGESLNEKALKKQNNAPVVQVSARSETVGRKGEEETGLQMP